MQQSLQLFIDFNEKPEERSQDLPNTLKTEENPNEMMLAYLAHELKFKHAYDKLTSLSNSRTRLLPHQIESTYIISKSLKPRFLIADEVGLGKTIEAGLVIKELMLRRGYSKILVVTPPTLLYQWKAEMMGKFLEDFTILNRKNFEKEILFSSKRKFQYITSLDFIKNPKYGNEILKQNFDLVIFDEAHRLRRDYSKITRGHIFAEKISKRTESLLLLSATPFRGKLVELYYLIHLLDPTILGPHETFVNEYVLGSKTDLKEKLSKVIIRRRKIEVGGFTKRFAKTIKFDLSDAERSFYDETTEYVKREYNLAISVKNRAVGFVMIVFQKLLDSSATALIQALTKRKFQLENKFHFYSQNTFNFNDIDLDDTENVESILDEIQETDIPDLKKMRQEILTLNRLVYLGKAIKEDRKTQKVKEILLKLRKEGHKKFLIFTQFRTTQEYLQNALSDFSVCIFHGSQSNETKEEVILDFKNNKEVLICTEAGGEGRNLQFCNVLINYDLPWSPLKIEQRIGRIHRFGQKDNVFIFNFASKDTVAERILEVLETKIQLFNESIGISDELLGSVEDELDFQSSFMKFVTGNKTKVELESELQNRIHTAKKGFEKLNALVTPKFVDFNLDDFYQHSIQERTHDNSDLEDFIQKVEESFPELLKKKIKRTKTHFELVDDFGKTKKATFNSELALADDSLEFLAFGHPLVDSSISHFIENSIGSCYKQIQTDLQQKSIYYVFIINFDFYLRKKILVTLQLDKTDHSVKLSKDLPERVLFSKNATQAYPPMFQELFLKIKPSLDLYMESEKQKLIEEHLPLFSKEKYKLLLGYRKNLQLLNDKLQEKEAKLKWNNQSELKPVINRLKNKINKENEEFEQQNRKILSEEKIHTSFRLFQVYEEFA